MGGREGREGIVLFLLTIIPTCVITHLVYTVHTTHKLTPNLTVHKVYHLYCTVIIPFHLQVCTIFILICSGHLKFVKESVQMSGFVKLCHVHDMCNAYIFLQVGIFL